MPSVDHFNLRSFDLNLLISFDALMRERNVTQAAARLRIQQPAMSHALSTLRLLFNDELFVRVGNAMQPTAKAVALSASVTRILEQSQMIILTKSNFEPSLAERTFRLGFSCDELLLLPELSSSLSSFSKGLRIIAQRALADQVGKDLDDETIDLAIGCFTPSPSRYRSLELFRQELVCCYNAELFESSIPLDLRSYLSARHAVVSPQHDLQGCFIGLLSDAGYEVDAAVSVADYLTALTTVASAPLIVTLPRQIAERHAPAFGLTMSAAPIALELPPVSMIWSAQSDNEPSTEWLRQQIIGVAKQNSSNIVDFKQPTRTRAVQRTTAQAS